MFLIWILTAFLFGKLQIPKMKAYVSDTEDLKQDPSYQETWDDMIVNVSFMDS